MSGGCSQERRSKTAQVLTPEKREEALRKGDGKRPLAREPIPYLSLANYKWNFIEALLLKNCFVVEQNDRERINTERKRAYYKKLQ